MATETNMQPVNGNYSGPPHYNAAELPAPTPPAVMPNGASNAPASASGAPNADPQDNQPSKDEVGWYFVEQYYTTLSKSPEKLHLFYNKKSQFVSGVEAEKAPVSVGQRAIDQRIKEMDVEDCKVRVTNVDSQDSQDKSIVIQVIGEMSIKDEPHRKFIQTFVLAKQQNGYYVLNDIFRYIAEDEEKEIDESAAAEPEAPVVPAEEIEIKTLTSSDDLVAQAKAAEIVDQKLEQSVGSEPAALAASVPTPPVAVPAVPENIGGTGSQRAESQKDIEEIEQAVEGIEIEDELPKDPEPTPAPPSPQVEAAPAVQKEPAAPPKPAAPKTWASMLAGGAAKAAAAVIPAVPNSSAPLSHPKKAPSVTAPVAPPIATDTPPAEEIPPLASPGGWQTAGQEHNRKQTRQATTTSANVNRDGSIKAYVKNVTERVDGALLKAALAKHGKIEYFDISRQKNCAFVEFADVVGFNAAVAANPHVINGEDIYVEERHIRQQPYGQGFNARGGRGGMRGGMNDRGNGQGGRGGFNKDGRGGYQPRGRGGTMTPRGRGMPQAA